MYFHQMTDQPVLETGNIARFKLPRQEQKHTLEEKVDILLQQAITTYEVLEVFIDLIVRSNAKWESTMEYIEDEQRQTYYMHVNGESKDVPVEEKLDIIHEWMYSADTVLSIYLDSFGINGKSNGKKQ